MKAIMEQLAAAKPLLWVNAGWQTSADGLAAVPLTRDHLLEAELRWQRFAPLLQQCFPELESSNGIIESTLCPADALARRLECLEGLPPGGRWLIKADHALPVAGSIKARGGIYAVLCVAERIARAHGMQSDTQADARRLLTPAARQLFGGHTLTVGSTGNLGLSIGIMGAALGFEVVVHMSRDAKAWKKQRLRDRGVIVREHAQDYTAACAAARDQAIGNPRVHFIDDENSADLFLGYSTAIFRLKRQLDQAGIKIDAAHPLVLYLPCGVGGAPGGITFAARHVFGDAAHCFLVEPVQAPCMLLGLCSGRHADSSVYELGLTLQTDADGLAVARPSRFVGRVLAPLVSGCLTVSDPAAYRYLLDLYETLEMEVEPSAAMACAGPGCLYGTDPGRIFRAQYGIPDQSAEATQIIWTTGGCFVPPEQHAAYRRQALTCARPTRSGA